MVTRRTVLAGLLAFALLPAAPSAADGDSGFVVVVHADNPTDALSRREVSRMFLKQRKRWDHGERVRPVDLSEGQKVRDAFSLGIFRRRTLDIENHWKSMVLSGRDVPPPEKASEAEVLEYVATHAGAIGYVSPETPLIEGVAPLAIIE